MKEEQNERVMIESFGIKDNTINNDKAEGATLYSVKNTKIKIIIELDTKTCGKSSHGSHCGAALCKNYFLSAEKHRGTGTYSRLVVSGHDRAHVCLH